MNNTSWEPRWYHFVVIGLIPLANPYVLGPLLLRGLDKLVVGVLRCVLSGDFGG